MGSSQSSQTTGTNGDKRRRRYIARGEAGETTGRDPATFHPPSSSTAPHTGGNHEPTLRAHTFDAPASSSNVQHGPPGGAAGLTRSHTTEGAIGLSQPFTSARPGEADTKPPFSSQYGRRDSGSSETSFRSAHSDVSGGLTTRGCFGSKDSGSSGISTGSYPATFPGPKVRWQYNPLAEISEAGKEKYQQQSPSQQVSLSKVGVFNPAASKSASLPAGTAPPQSGYYKAPMDQGGCTGYKYGLKQGIASLFGSKKPGSESSVLKPAQEGSKSHSVSDLVQCSPKQAKRFSGHFQAVNIDIDEPAGGVKNESVVKPPWQQTPKEKYTYQAIRPKMAESVTNKGIQTSLSGAPTFHSSQVPYAQQAFKKQPVHGVVGVPPSSYPYSNVQTVPTSTVATQYGTNVQSMQAEPYSFSQTVVTTSAPTPYSNVQTVSKPELTQRTSSKNVTAGAGNLTKEERIAQYKDKRRKELATMFSSSDKSSIDYGEDLSSNIIKKTQATKGWSKEEKPEKKDPSTGTIAPISHPSSTTFTGKSISPKPIMPDVQMSAEMAPNLSPSGNVPDILASTHPSAFTKVHPSSHKSVTQSSPSSQMPLAAVSKASAPSLARSPKPASTSHKDVLPPWKQPAVVTTAIAVSEPVIFTEKQPVAMATAPVAPLRPVAITTSIPTATSQMSWKQPVTVTTAGIQEPVKFTEKQPVAMAAAPVRPVAITTSIPTLTSQTSASLSSVLHPAASLVTTQPKMTSQDYVTSGRKRSSLDSEMSKMDSKLSSLKASESVISHFPSAAPTVTTASITTSSVSLMPVEALSPATSRRSRLMAQRKNDQSSSLESAKPKLTSHFKATEQSTSLDRLIEGLAGLASAADRTEFMEGLATISDPTKPKPVKKSESLTSLELRQLPRKVETRKGSDQLYMDKDKNLVSATISTHIPQDYKKSMKPVEKFGSIELRVTEEDKPKQAFPKKLTRMDSFNRPDSPIREPMPLPKDSVIARNRRPRRGSSSSTDSDPGRSPRVSPRVVRKHKKMGSSDMSTLSVKHGREAKPTEQLLSPHGESSSSSRFSRSPQIGQGHSLKDTGLSPTTKKKKVPTATLR